MLSSHLFSSRALIWKFVFPFFEVITFLEVTFSLTQSVIHRVVWSYPSTHLRNISGVCPANLRQTSGISLAYLMQISGIFQANLTHISGIYLRYISGKSLTNLWQIYYHYNLLMSITFVQITTMIIFAYNFYSHWYCASMYDPRTCLLVS